MRSSAIRSILELDIHRCVRALDLKCRLLMVGRAEEHLRTIGDTESFFRQPNEVFVKSFVPALIMVNGRGIDACFGCGKAESRESVLGWGALLLTSFLPFTK